MGAGPRAAAPRLGRQRCGRLSEVEVPRRIGDIRDLDEAGVDAFMSDVWNDYLGALTTERGPVLPGSSTPPPDRQPQQQFRRGPGEERERYGFEDLTDLIVSSPENALRTAAVDGARLVGMHGVLFRGNARAMTDIGALLAAPAAPTGRRRGARRAGRGRFRGTRESG
jgi:hypothetical protein